MSESVFWQGFFTSRFVGANPKASVLKASSKGSGSGKKMAATKEVIFEKCFEMEEKGDGLHCIGRVRRC